MTRYILLPLWISFLEMAVPLTVHCHRRYPVRQKLAILTYTVTHLFVSTGIVLPISANNQSLCKKEEKLKNIAY